MKTYKITYGLLDEDYEYFIEANDDMNAYIKGVNLIRKLVDYRETAKGVHMRINEEEKCQFLSTNVVNVALQLH